MQEYMKALNKFLAENNAEPDYTGVSSLLDMLYCCYENRPGIDPEEIQAGFDALYNLLGETVPGKGDDIIHAACRLCGVYQKQAFRDGVILGFRLYTELQIEIS